MEKPGSGSFAARGRFAAVEPFDVAFIRFAFAPAEQAHDPTPELYYAQTQAAMMNYAKSPAEQQP